MAAGPSSGAGAALTRSLPSPIQRLNLSLATLLGTDQRVRQAAWTTATLASTTQQVLCPSYIHADCQWSTAKIDHDRALQTCRSARASCWASLHHARHGTKRKAVIGIPGAIQNISTSPAPALSLSSRAANRALLSRRPPGTPATRSPVKAPTSVPAALYSRSPMDRADRPRGPPAWVGTPVSQVDISTSASISTGVPNGSSAIPTADRL